MQNVGDEGSWCHDLESLVVETGRVYLSLKRGPTACGRISPLPALFAAT